MAAQGDRLYDSIEFILNQATEEELEVVRAALKRRIEGDDVHGPMGLNPARLARETAASVQRQLGSSIEGIRDMVRRFAVEVIRKEAPELSEEQVSGLLEAWVPQPGSARDVAADAAPGAGTAPPGSAARRVAGAKPSIAGQSAAAAGSRSRRGGTELPPQVMLTLVSQFVAYATESMPVSEQVRLHDEIPGWQQKYWGRFSPRVRELISLHLSGALERGAFWERIAGELGIDLPGGEL